MTTPRIFTTFLLDSLLFGVPAAAVLELTHQRQLTRVPLAPPMVEGLMNLRGQLVTAIDLRRRLGLAPRLDAAPPMNVVLTTAEGPVSLIVDQIGEVLELGDEVFEPPPENVRGIARELLLGVYKLPGRLLLILDPHKVTDIASLSAQRKLSPTPASS